MISQFGSIALSTPSGCPRFVTTKGNIQKVKCRLRRKKSASARKLSMKLGISDMSVWQITENDLGLHSYKVVIKPLLFGDQKIKRKKLANLVRTNFPK